MLGTSGDGTSGKPVHSALEARGEKPLLVVRDVGIEFGGIAALKNVSFNVPRGDIVGLIGPNGFRTWRSFRRFLSATTSA